MKATLEIINFVQDVITTSNVCSQGVLPPTEEE